MTFSTELHALVAAIRDVLVGVGDPVAGGIGGRAEHGVSLHKAEGKQPNGLGIRVHGLDDGALLMLAELVVQAKASLDQLSLLVSGEIGARSTRDAGHSGLAQSRGHRTPVALLQQIAGVTRAEAIRQLRVGTSLLEVEAGDSCAGTGFSAPILAPPSLGGLPGLDETGPFGGAPGAPADGAAGGPTSATANGLPDVASGTVPWHAPLATALIRGSLSAAQHDAIKQGLGEPPLSSANRWPEPGGSPASGPGGSGPSGSGLGGSGLGGSGPSSSAAEVRAAWSLAAERLIEYAAENTVEELAKQSRAIRNLLDPAGARDRYLARYERRSFRMWSDADGIAHGSFVFDDESAAWIRSIIDSALRPRRGGPRFVTAAEQKQAAALRDDPRTNEQLTHDLLLDVMKAGAVADAKTVFGARQAGIKLVQVVQHEAYHAGRTPTTTRLLEGGDTLPFESGDAHRCNTGVQSVIVDDAGDPLHVGREQRLFTSKQRVALAVRDGGCRWPGCDRPASYCEAHHIDQWVADQGRTDVDRGVLLCRFHHMQLHYHGGKITRDGRGPFMLHRGSRARLADRGEHGSITQGSGVRSQGQPDEPLGAPPGAPPHLRLGERLERPPVEPLGDTRASPPGNTRTGPPGNTRASPPGNTRTGPPGNTRASPPGNTRTGPPGNTRTGPPGEESAVRAETTSMNAANDPQTNPVELRPPLPLTYAWQLAAPPGKRFRTAA